MFLFIPFIAVKIILEYGVPPKNDEMENKQYARNRWF